MARSRDIAFGGAAIYENGLQNLSMHSNWLVSGALAFYFAGGKKPGTKSALLKTSMRAAPAGKWASGSTI